MRSEALRTPAWLKMICGSGKPSWMTGGKWAGHWGATGTAVVVFFVDDGPDGRVPPRHLGVLELDVRIRPANDEITIDVRDVAGIRSREAADHLSSWSVTPKPLSAPRPSAEGWQLEHPQLHENAGSG